MKKWKNMLVSALLAVVIALSSGCSKKTDYGEEFNLETDCQYSYYSNVDYWKKIQSDGSGQYIINNDFIYYYNTETATMTPLCNKPNCLHDMETDESKLSDCNAYARVSIAGSEYIQYYDGYIYYFSAPDNYDIFITTLYRVSKDGSKKDKIFTTDDEMIVNNWLIHRGYLYYAINSYYYGEDESTQVYEKTTLKSLELSSNMSEKNAEVIFESDEEHTILSLWSLKAYKNYLCYGIDCNTNGVEWTTTDSWYQQLYRPVYIYNIETGENQEIPVPEGYSETTTIGGVEFLEDKMLLALCDGLHDVEYQLPVYSIKYDLTDEKIWVDSKEQAKYVQTYDDYVVITDGWLQYFPYLYSQIVSDADLDTDDSELCTNVEIYSSDGELVSYFVYPINNKGSFSGFGPDGVNVTIEENDDSWSVYELNFDDVLDCHGEEVELTLVNTREYGTLNKEE